MTISSVRPEERHRIITGLSTDTKPTSDEVKASTRFIETDTCNEYQYSGTQWCFVGSLGQSGKSSGFTPSQYDADLTMNGAAQAVALATGVALGLGKIKVVNRGAAGEAIRVAFGTSASNAENNLTIVGGAATTGDYVPSLADGNSETFYNVPALATHYAVANDVALDTQIVSVTQGV